MFDTYSIKARVYPVVILFFPLVILGISYSLHFESVIHIASSVGLVGTLTYLFSQLGRDQGKIKESELWNSWGGAPSVQVLRFSNSVIDTYTKQRYHEKLLKLCAVNIIPNHELEKGDIKAVDEVYFAWTRFLITKTRDTKVFNLLFKENTNYGFRRNLWALKPFAFFTILLLLVGNFLYNAMKLDDFNPTNFGSSYWVSSIGLLIILLLWIFVITKQWVKIPAFAYASRLCEAIDQL